MGIEEMVEGAPQEMKDAMFKHSESIKRLRRAEMQFDLWRKELSLATQAWKSTEADYTQVLLRYKDGEMKPDEKIML